MSNLRSQLKAARKNVPYSKRCKSERTAWKILSRHHCFSQAEHIASYHDVNGEFSTSWINERILDCNKKLYLPLLAKHPVNHLEFQRQDKNTSFIRNRFGIPEPVRIARQQRPAQQLDLVLMPLLGFDATGTRMGMGGGFYDRSFSFLHGNRRHRKILLIGLAFNLQQLPMIERQPWDVPLDAILTESGLRFFRQNHN